MSLFFGADIHIGGFPVAGDSFSAAWSTKRKWRGASASTLSMPRGLYKFPVGHNFSLTVRFCSWPEFSSYTNFD